MKNNKNWKTISMVKIIEWDMGHRIVGSGKDNNLHGHHYKLEMEIEGMIQKESGMIIDLRSLKKIMQKHVVDQFDHAFVFSKSDALMVNFFHTNKKLKWIELKDQPTIENIGQLIYKMLENSLKQADLNLKIKRLKLWESESSCIILS